MPTINEQEKVCGNCGLFEPPLGGGERQLCRAILGLRYGLRTPKSKCEDPSSFKPIAENPQLQLSAESPQLLPSSGEVFSAPEA
jgi:hypothetical protein